MHDSGISHVTFLYLFDIDYQYPVMRYCYWQCWYLFLVDMEGADGVGADYDGAPLDDQDQEDQTTRYICSDI